MMEQNVCLCLRGEWKAEKETKEASKLRNGFPIAIRDFRKADTKTRNSKLEMKAPGDPIHHTAQRLFIVLLPLVRVIGQIEKHVAENSVIPR
ncbi:hypothetical protein K1719_025320 [Acacia pycnantha]|nr:hypothetical protein K1719_025320 [Acacia pycnantha]